MDEQQARRSRPWGLWSGAVLASLVLYVLSTGPIVWLDHHKLLPDAADNIIRVVYFPFVFIGDDESEILRPIKTTMEAYWSLWE